MKGTTETSKELAQLACVTCRGTKYETDTLTKVGAYFGLKVGVGTYVLERNTVYIAKQMAKATGQPFIRSMSTRAPVVIPAVVVVGAALGRMAQTFEDITGKTTVSDYVIANYVNGKAAVDLDINL
ncbi:hypothetical protein [Endozoicomonas acroporae]|uniref:hypothetical protein n=1 Tax=Endozoicomonas acroporae TaxID=1701104 RepID=UPI0013D7916B|nr:hypothetical protein [Endozoicomonas acroporae]